MDVGLDPVAICGLQFADCRARDLDAGQEGRHKICAREQVRRLHLPLEMIEERCRTINRSVPDETPSRQSDLQNHQEPEEDWIPPLSDQDLRVVFSGLLGNK